MGNSLLIPTHKPIFFKELFYFVLSQYMTLNATFRWTALQLQISNVDTKVDYSKSRVWWLSLAFSGNSKKGLRITRHNFKCTLTVILQLDNILYDILTLRSYAKYVHTKVMYVGSKLY